MSTKAKSFDQLYPGTYLKAGEFGGKAVTLTIQTITREMLSNGTGGEEGAVIVAFSETPKLFVMNKTNAVCLRAMWGDDPSQWDSHRITLHPVKDESGLSESGYCIRVLGSPELKQPLKFRARLGRKMVTQTLVPTAKGSHAEAPAFDAETGEVDDDPIGFTEEAPYADIGQDVTETATGGDVEPDGYREASEADYGPDGVIPGLDAAGMKARRKS